MAKLTLSVDGEVVSRAKRYAKQRGASVSKMVETYLAAVTGVAPQTEDTPVLRSLRGVLKNGSGRVPATLDGQISMIRLLLDVDVLLDVLEDRRPPTAASGVGWAEVGSGHPKAWCPRMLIHYLVRKGMSAAKWRRWMDQPLRHNSSAREIASKSGERKLKHAPPQPRAVIREALQMSARDFKDAVSTAAARTAGCDYLVTRDPKGFRGSPVRILTPDEAVALLRLV